MGVFLDLLGKLEEDITTVHGEPLPIVWRFDPMAPAPRCWSAYVEDRGAFAPHEAAEGPSGEDPLRRLAETYAARALAKRESST